MPRLVSLLPLPLLTAALGKKWKFVPEPSRTEQVVAALRTVILANRSTQGGRLYPISALTKYFGVSQRTAAVAVERLESEGLVVRIRGSHTEVVGVGVVRRSDVQAVVGFPMWAFGMRFSQLHNRLASELGERLWTRDIAVDTIFYNEIEDLEPDFGRQVLRHKIDYCVWLFPYPHYREALGQLKDAGVRNLVIGHGAQPSMLSPSVILDFEPAYNAVLKHWRDKLGLGRVLVVRSGEYASEHGMPNLRKVCLSRGYEKMFARLAEEAGMICEVVESTPGLAASILKDGRGKEGKPVAIALLDEHASAEFVHYDPASVLGLLERGHRLLFGNEAINMAYVPQGKFTVERTFVYVDGMAAGVMDVLNRWRTGDYSGGPVRVATSYSLGFLLHRYV